jgi:hypothetical protein
MLRSAWRCALPLLAVLAGAPAAAEPSPADIVKKIYEQATVFCNGEDVAPPYTDKFMREVFDKPVADRYLARLHRAKSTLTFSLTVRTASSPTWLSNRSKQRQQRRSCVRGSTTWGRPARSTSSSTNQQACG